VEGEEMGLWNSRQTVPPVKDTFSRLRWKGSLIPFPRFGNPSQLPSPLQKEYGTFAQHFVTHFAPEIFKVYLQQIELYVSGQAWLSKKCQYQILQFFTEWFVLVSFRSFTTLMRWGQNSVKPQSTWALLKPHFESLVSNFVFPNLSFTSAMQELWQSDPVDYTRTSIGASPLFEFVLYGTPANTSSL
jgi:hypothetical protein